MSPSLRLRYTTPCELIFSWRQEPSIDPDESAYKNVQIFMLQTDMRPPSRESICHINTLRSCVTDSLWNSIALHSEEPALCVRFGCHDNIDYSGHSQFPHNPIKLRIINVASNQPGACDA